MADPGWDFASLRHCLKNTIYYVNNHQTVDALKKYIRIEIRRIAYAMLDLVITNFNVRVSTVIQRQGAWIEHIIKY